MASMMVALDVSSLMLASGREAASSARPMAARNSAGGRWRRHVRPEQKQARHDRQQPKEIGRQEVHIISSKTLDSYFEML
jgi:hypothetical protein